MKIQCPACTLTHTFHDISSTSRIVCRCGQDLMPGSGIPNTLPADLDGVAKKELSALIEISRLLVSTATKDELLNSILTVSREAMKVEACSIILYDRERDDMTFYMSTGPGEDEITRIRLAKGEGIAGWVFLNRQSVIVNDTAGDHRFSRKVDDSVQYTSKNLMCVPVRAGQDIIGVMEAVNKIGAEGFNEVELNLFESIANHAGGAIEKARLIEENLKSMRLAAIGQTFSTLSHCIKNILNGLSGGTYIINKALADNKMERVREGWEIVDTCIARITDLSMNMLAYSKDRTPQYKMVNLNMTIREALHILTKKLEEQSVLCALELDEKLAEVPVDSYGIFRCLLNILTNALEACPDEKGTITIRSYQSSTDTVTIEIEDNGSGMDESSQQKVFSLFYSTKGGRGTGLGLAVTKKIIDEHRGRIWLEPGQHAGTRVFLELPVSRTAGDADGS